MRPHASGNGAGVSPHPHPVPANPRGALPNNVPNLFGNVAKRGTNSCISMQNENRLPCQPSLQPHWIFFDGPPHKRRHVPQNDPRGRRPGRGALALRAAAGTGTVAPRADRSGFPRPHGRASVAIFPHVRANMAT